MNLPKHLNLKAAVGLILISVILTASIAYYVFAATPSSTFWVEPGVYPGAPSYTIWRDGSYYYAKDENGHMPTWAGITNATEICNSAFSTSEGMFKLRGNFELDGPLYPLDNQTLDLYEATLNQMNSLACGIDVFSVSNIKILGGTIKNGYNGIHIAQSISLHGMDKPNNITVKDVTIFATEHDGLHITNSSKVTVTNCDISSIYTGIRVDEYSENVTISTNFISYCYEHGIRAYSTAKFINVFGNKVYFANQTGIDITSPFSLVSQNIIDSPSQASSTNPAITIGSYSIASQNQIFNSPYFAIIMATNSSAIGNTIKNSKHGLSVVDWNIVSANNLFNVTDYAFQISGNYSVISNNLVLDASRGAKLLSAAISNTITSCSFQECDWGIQIDSGCDYNIIIGVDTRTSTNGIIDAGSNNHINLCWNSTTWIS